MRDEQVGRALKALRCRRRLTQQQLAAAVALSPSLISKIERGRVENVQLGTLRRVAGELDAIFSSVVWWRGGELDRVLDEAHALLCAAAATRLARHGWDVTAEATFSEYGERGSIDLLAVRRDLGTALVVEVKSELYSVEELLRRIDVKARLAAGIVRDRQGWLPRAVWRLLVLPDVSTARRRVARHDALLGRVFPDRGLALRDALRDPSPRSRSGGTVSGVWFLSSSIPGSSKRRPFTAHRVRRRDSGSSATGRAE